MSWFTFLEAWRTGGFFHATRVFHQNYYDNLFSGCDLRVYFINLLFEFVILILIVATVFAVILGVLLAGAAVIDAVIFLCKSHRRRDS
jgi:predicted outer membrane lipoprotein